MPRGQFYTVFTLGFATAFGLLGALVAAVLFWSGEAWAWATIILNAHQVPQSWLEPAYMAAFVAGAALFIAYWIVRIQQAITGWAADRAIAQLSREYKDIAARLGRSQADEFARLKVIDMLDGADAKRFDLFGRAEVIRSMAAAGMRPPEK